MSYRPVDNVAELLQHIQLDEPLVATSTKKKGPKNHIHDNIRRLKGIQELQKRTKEAEHLRQATTRPRPLFKPNRTSGASGDNDSRFSESGLMIEGSMLGDHQNSKARPMAPRGLNRTRSEVSSAATEPPSSSQPRFKPSSESVQSAPPRRAGVIPKYLKVRKQEWKEQEERELLAKKQAEIPAGHNLLSDAERTKTLGILKENHDALLKELTSLPVGMDTLRLRDRKSDLEKQLRQVEEAMKVFSKNKVFVKCDN